MLKNTTTFLKDYQPYPFIVKTASLDFDLYDDYVLVRNRMHMQRCHPGMLRLSGQGLELVSLVMNEQSLSAEDYQLDADGLVLKSCPDDVMLIIETRIRPQDNTQLSGLYRSKALFCTQCEAEGFRRITFFPDRPDVLAVYTTRISADKARYPVLLSNGNQEAAGDDLNGRHWVVWHDPFKKPSYLFALVAGHLSCVRDEFITCSGKKVDLRIYVEPGNEGKCAHAMLSLKKAMRWDEEKYGREYDLNIFMIVAVSDFNMGAMENKGLNIFNSKFILASPDTATDQDYANIEGVVAHEYFHNWTGNRITCRDWFQLSLKEGLTVFRDQEFSRDMNSRDVNRIADVIKLHNIQFPEDAGFMAHPVRPTSYQEINNFYTATIYNKGAEVIRMQQTILGPVGFRRGTDLYFQRHDGQAVTIDDFVAAMEDANGVSLSQFKTWYNQAGTPQVRVESQYGDGQLKLTFRQTCRKTPECESKQPFHIPIHMALFNAEGKQLPVEQPVLAFNAPEQSFYFDGLQDKPIVSLLRGFSAPIALNYEMDTNDRLMLMRFETDGYAKWNAAQVLILNCMTACYQTEPSQWQVPQALLDALQQVFVDEALDPALRAEILTPPSYEDMANTLTEVDVSLVEAVRDFYRKTLGHALWSNLLAMYQKLWRQEDHAMDAIAFGRRKLRNLCLWLMMKTDETTSLTLCQQQFAEALTMTDKMASLALIVSSPRADVCQKALDTFYQHWQHDDLVLDKWFTVQACSELSQTLARVSALLLHPDFNLKNPNRVRALVGAFTQMNPRYFHAVDGTGYVFLTEMLIKLDKINSQISARLATPFTRWQCLDKPRQALMKQQLERLAKLEISRDLREMVSKSLG